MGLFVSSTERPTFYSHLPKHTPSTLPERFGCDVAWNVEEDWWGVQRKEVADFIASVQDGRLAKEVGQMKQTVMPHVVVEGDVRFTNEGVLIWNNWGAKDVTKKQWQGMVWSLQRAGVAVTYARTARDTAATVVSLIEWSSKDRHSSMARRPGPVGKWGKADSREFGEHLLMGLPGVGPELATRIWDAFGCVPWQWTVTEAQLLAIEGIGKVKARQILDAFGVMATAGLPILGSAA